MGWGALSFYIPSDILDGLGYVSIQVYRAVCLRRHASQTGCPGCHCKWARPGRTQSCPFFRSAAHAEMELDQLRRL